MQAEPRKVGAIECIAVGNAQIADQRDPEAAANGVAIECADHRHLQFGNLQKGAVGCQQPLMWQLLLHPVAAEVAPSTETAAAPGDDQAAHLGFDLQQSCHGLSESGDQIGGHAVAVVGAVQGDLGHPIVEGKQNGGGIHGEFDLPVFML